MVGITLIMSKRVIALLITVTMEVPRDYGVRVETIRDKDMYCRTGCDFHERVRGTS